MYANLPLAEKGAPATFDCTKVFVRVTLPPATYRPPPNEVPYGPKPKLAGNPPLAVLLDRELDGVLGRVLVKVTVPPAIYSPPPKALPPLPGPPPPRLLEPTESERPPKASLPFTSVP